MTHFVICVSNESNPGSLILGKVYRALPDAAAEAHNMSRVIGEDKSEPDGYLYPTSMFVPTECVESCLLGGILCADSRGQSGKVVV